MKDSGIKAGVYIGSATTLAKKRTVEKNPTSPTPKKARHGKADDSEKTIKAFRYPSVTKNSSVKVQWKDGEGKFCSVDELTNEEAEYAAIQARDARVAAESRRYNREYMTYIGQRRIKHLLTLESPEECEEFFGAMETEGVFDAYGGRCQPNHITGIWHLDPATGVSLSPCTTSSWQIVNLDTRINNMAVFRAVSVQTPQHNKDMIAVKVDGREDVAVFEKTSDQHDETAQDIFKTLNAAESQRYPLAHFNALCQHRLTRPLSQHEFDTFCRNQQEENENNNESYKTRVLSMYKQNPYLFSRATATAAVDTAADDADDGDDPKRSFNGHCVDCIDSGIPHGYRTMIITHVGIKGASAAQAILHMLISMKTSPLPSTLNTSVKMP
ncbi:hypothetical protein HG530_004384 [Fusarium avenaceum]|nr:hypothetical protein HG530_004384 [Fusarium avenaceum]